MRTNIEAVLTPIWLLALSILVTIYLAWGFYYFDVDWMHLLNYVVIGKSDLWHNFNVLMRYLPFPWVGRLAMPDFPSSESGLKHFHDVKWLFHLVQILVVLLAYPAVSFLWRNVKKGTFGLYRRLYLSLAVLPILIGVVGFFLGFDHFFILFHEALFPGDSSWLFNPMLDPIINVLPEEYFLQCFVIFFIMYEGIMMGLTWLAHKQVRSYLKNKE